MTTVELEKQKDVEIFAQILHEWDSCADDIIASLMSVGRIVRNISMLNEIIEREENRKMKEKEILLLKVRINNIKARGKYIDCPGVLKKLERQLRNLED